VKFSTMVAGRSKQSRTEYRKSFAYLRILP
jgi:hypothetical protein